MVQYFFMLKFIMIVLRRARLSVFVLIICIKHFCDGSPLIGPNVRHAEDDEFPFAVSLSRNVKSVLPEKYHICGGTLITPKHVLTAAHCLRTFKHRHAGDIVIKVNDGDLVDSQNYQIEKWTTYDEWSNIEVANESINDVAIIQLAKCVKSKIKPAVLTNLTEAQINGKKAVIAGWGNIEDDVRPRYLMTAEMNILIAQDCLRNLRGDVISNLNNPPHVFLCTIAEPPVYTECGDSGSPLLVEKNEIIGVNRGHCTRRLGQNVEKQNLFMSVEYYKEFITDVTKCKGRACCIQS